MKLINKGYCGVTVFGMDRVLWGAIAVITCTMLLMFGVLYFGQLDHEKFDISIATIPCLELEEIILGTWDGDMHFVNESYEKISAIHNLRCK